MNGRLVWLDKDGTIKSLVSLAERERERVLVDAMKIHERMMRVDESAPIDESRRRFRVVDGTRETLFDNIKQRRVAERRPYPKPSTVDETIALNEHLDYLYDRKEAIANGVKPPPRSASNVYGWFV